MGDTLIAEQPSYNDVDFSASCPPIQNVSDIGQNFSATVLPSSVGHVNGPPPGVGDRSIQTKPCVVADCQEVGRQLGQPEQGLFGALCDLAEETVVAGVDQVAGLLPEQPQVQPQSGPVGDTADITPGNEHYTHLAQSHTQAFNMS